jgi:hypothetical protein
MTHAIQTETHPISSGSGEQAEIPAARRRWPWVVAVLVLCSLAGAAIGTAIDGGAGGAAVAATSLPTVSLPAEPALPPGTEFGVLGDPSSIRAASAWVEALEARDGDLARLMLCSGGLELFPDGGSVLAEFDRVVGGLLASHSIVDVQRADGRDRVVFGGLDDSGRPVSFVVSVIVVPEGRSICGISPM